MPPRYDQNQTPNAHIIMDDPSGPSIATLELKAARIQNEEQAKRIAFLERLVLRLTEQMYGGQS
jgi:hypothetical protein